jgi:hypothetical protein
MIYLTEISFQRKTAVNYTLTVDPLVASDMDYCIKTWMGQIPEIACRPWRSSDLREGIRVTGWRRDKPGMPADKIYVGHWELSYTAGEKATFTTRFIPLRRAGRSARDAAAGRLNPEIAYQQWLSERLIDIADAASTDSVEIERHFHRRVLRKISRDREHSEVQYELIPVVDATVQMTVKHPDDFEAWLLAGVGPQKVFGYGAFIPTPEKRKSP